MAPPAKTPALLRDAGPTSTVRPDERRRPEQQTLPLTPLETATPPAGPPLATRPQSLWLCLYLPSLPLEALHSDAAAVFEEQQGLCRILQATAAAAAAGIHPGLSVNAALALKPGLQIEERQPQRERRALRQLAGWAERYTSLVVVEAPAVLLLEIAASLRLFGGLAAMRQRLLRDLEAQGFTAQPAIAPTPLAATWLARAGRRQCIGRLDRLPGALCTLPVHCLAWPATVTASLREMGITAIGDCLRLPRAGFARRFGASRLLQLDRALGRLPDPRASHRTPPRFCEDCELDEEQSDREQLLAVCAQLLQKLARFLLTRQLRVQRLQFVFYHLQAPATPLTLASVQMLHDTEHWMALLRIRLERLELPAPVIAIRLCAGRGQPLEAKSAALGFGQTERRGTSIAHLVERLRARLAYAAVHGVATVAEHRPDRAWRKNSGDSLLLSGARQEQRNASTTEISKPSPDLRRPLWMLDTPEPLAGTATEPRYAGPLTFEAGPERIETGWWDEAGIARDYYVARNPAGAELWVFRNRGNGSNWYLHGLFG